MNENTYGVGLYNDGVFYFTNPGLAKIKHPVSQEESNDYFFLWNNREYKFEAKKTVAFVIANETPESIQKIRKLAAKKYAQAWFHTTKRYKDMVKAGKNLPATYNEDTEFGAVIQQCLTPLPKGQLTSKEVPRESDANYKGSKAIGGTADLNAVFADYEVPTLGQQN